MAKPRVKDTALPTARLEDVAQLAGVSVSTVSRALQQPHMVNASTRAAVLQAVEQTGYRVNMAARNLRMGRTGAVLALVPNLHNTFHAEVLSGISDALVGQGLSLLVADARQAARIDPRRADGLILLDARICAPVLVAQARLGRCPTVLVDDDDAAPDGWPLVHSDNHGGAVQAVRHLLSRGYRRIGHLGGPAGSGAARAREAGLRQALKAAGLAPVWRHEGNYSMDSGADAARALLNSSETPPDAVFCVSDSAAVGFATHLLGLGWRIPQDIAIIGFDDIDLAAAFRVGLSTVHQPRADLGRRAVEVLDRLIRGQEVAPTTVLPLRLVLRDSA